VKWRARADSTLYTARTCKIILERESALNWHAASVELERSSKQEKERKKQLLEARRGEAATTNREAFTLSDLNISQGILHGFSDSFFFHFQGLGFGLGCFIFPHDLFPSLFFFYLLVEPICLIL
jgi:hypothetical protein